LIKNRKTFWNFELFKKVIIIIISRWNKTFFDKLRTYQKLIYLVDELIELSN